MRAPAIWGNAWITEQHSFTISFPKQCKGAIPTVSVLLKGVRRLRSRGKRIQLKFFVHFYRAVLFWREPVRSEILTNRISAFCLGNENKIPCSVASSCTLCTAYGEKASSFRIGATSARFSALLLSLFLFWIKEIYRPYKSLRSLQRLPTILCRFSINTFYMRFVYVISWCKLLKLFCICFAWIAWN